MTHDIHWKQRYSNYDKALAQLTEFIEQPSLNKFEVQGLIQCFEYTFELGWKTMKDYLEQEGFDVKTPYQDFMLFWRSKVLFLTSWIS